MKKYNSFSELTAEWMTRPGNALIFERDGEKTFMTYSELYGAVTREAEEIRRSATSGVPDVLMAQHTPETVIRIFADVLAGRNLLLSESQIEPEILDAARQMISSGKNSDEEGHLYFFTSGTTTRSRVVHLTPRSLACSAYSGQSMLACGSSDTILSVLPLSHVFGFVCGMLWGLAYGAAIALGRGVRYLMEDCMYYDPTIFPAVPTIIEAVHRYHLFGPSLRVILIGAAPCTPELTKSLQNEDYLVYLGYGLTETSSGIAITQDQNDPYALAPCPGADIQVEPDGEISVATPCMMQGYLGETPLTEGERFYTGDLGSLDSRGWLHLSGRKKDMIVLADGTKVYCPEYEAELTAATGVRDLAIASRGSRPILVVAGEANRAFVQDAVDHFNSFRARSRQITDILYVAGPLPRTAVGKLKRWELQQMITDGAGII